jgi:hypothetical protein
MAGTSTLLGPLSDDTMPLVLTLDVSLENVEEYECDDADISDIRPKPKAKHDYRVYTYPYHCLVK